jgi:two-component system KDP operon response regulator KdpE
MTADVNGTPRILLVEDEELNRTLVRAVLSRATVPALRAADVVDAGSLAAARDELIAQDIDIVLLDMNLPDGKGLTLAREIATGATARGVPGQQRPSVIAVTASVLPQDRAAALEAGCDGFLEKPYAAADLVAAVVEQLATRGSAAVAE